MKQILEVKIEKRVKTLDVIVIIILPQICHLVSEIIRDSGTYNNVSDGERSNLIYAVH